MMIAVASDDQRTIASHTGRCQGFVVFEIREGQAVRKEYRENSFTGHAHGECAAGGHAHGAEHAHHSHGPLIDALGDCCAVVTRGLGPRLVTDLAAHGIDAYVCAVEDVDQAAAEFAAGRLPRVEGRGCCSH